MGVKNKILELSSNKLDYLSKIKWEMSTHGIKALVYNLTNGNNIVQEKHTCIIKWNLYFTNCQNMHIMV